MTADPENETVFYKLVVQYNGKRYNGFQRQKPSSQVQVESDATLKKRPRRRHQHRIGFRTVQDCLEEALSRWTNLSVATLRLRVSGRTDKGVHATGQVVAVDMPKGTLEEGLEEWQLCRALNTRLPNDVSVHSMVECAAEFEPRHGVVSKQYTYTIRFRRLVLGENNEPLIICNSGPHTLRTAHDSDCLYLCPWALDDSIMQDVCDILTGKHDFSCFVHKRARNQKDNVIDLTRFDVDYLPSSDDTSSPAPVCNVKFTLEACGFRRAMVRNLVGFVVDVCRGTLSQDDIPKFLTGDDEAASLVNCAPASGLCLSHVVY